MSPDLPVYIMLGFGLAGIAAIVLTIGFLPMNPDNRGEIQKNLGIIAAVTGILIGVFGGAAYMYFSANLNSLPTFLLCMTFINLFLSIFAVSAASLQITYS